MYATRDQKECHDLGERTPVRGVANPVGESECQGSVSCEVHLLVPEGTRLGNRVQGTRITEPTNMARATSATIAQRTEPGSSDSRARGIDVVCGGCREKRVDLMIIPGGDRSGAISPSQATLPPLQRTVIVRRR